MSDVETAVAAIKEGRLAVIPTDTVYGIAALTSSPEAIESVFTLKGRARGKGLPVLAAARDDLDGVAIFDERADKLATRYWPGPLTLVLPRAPSFEADLGGDGTSVAVRVPSHDMAREVLAGAGALAVTSANISGAWAATTVAEARAAVGHAIDVFLDGGRRDGVTSTIVSLLGDPEVLRSGPIPLDEILEVLKGGPAKEKIQLF